MTTTRPLLFWFLTLSVTAAFLTFGCGSGRQLQTVTLSPPNADAQSFPNGQVQFTATGTFSQPPSPVQLTSNDISWCMGGLGNPGGQCVGNANPGGTVTQNGLAQCNPMFTGTTTVLAGVAIPMSHPTPDSGPQLKVFGSATLTCP